MNLNKRAEQIAEQKRITCNNAFDDLPINFFNHNIGLQMLVLACFLLDFTLGKYTKNW